MSNVYLISTSKEVVYHGPQSDGREVIFMYACPQNVCTGLVYAVDATLPLGVAED